MRVAKAAQFRHEAGGRLVKAALALHRLDDDRGDPGRFQIGLEQLVQRLHRILGRNAVKRIGKGQVPDIRHHRPEARLVGLDLAGQRHPHEGAPVKAAREADDAGAAGVVAGDLDRVLDRLGAGRGKDRLFREIPRHQRVQPFRQRDVILVWHDLMAGMGEAVQLGAHGLDDAGMAVAGIHDRDACGKVDIAVAVLVPDLGILGALGIDLGGHAHPARDGGILAVGQAGHGMLRGLDRMSSGRERFATVLAACGMRQGGASCGCGP